MEQSNSLEVTFIISARNEARTLAFTISQLMLDCHQSGIEKYEFIVADNGSEDDTTRFWKFAWNDPYAKVSLNQRRQEYKLGLRGLASEGRVRFCYDPVFSNVGARHKAVKYARYKNIIFADAHIMVKPGSIKYTLETLEKYGGIVHAPVAWLGSSMDHPHPGIQYSYKVGEKIYGTWNFAQVAEEPFYIPGSGHCWIAVNKKQYLDFGGYDTNQQIYGGGEPWLDTLYWLMGSTVMVDPRALVFHLSAGRGYAYNTNSLIHNMMLTAYALGGHKWGERVLLTYLNKEGTDKQYFKSVYEIAVQRAQPKREMIEKRGVTDFDDLMKTKAEFDCDGSCRGAKYVGRSNHARRIWDIKNDELHGNHMSFVQVFDEWLTRLTDKSAIEFYKNSPNQHK